MGRLTRTTDGMLSDLDCGSLFQSVVAMRLGCPDPSQMAGEEGYVHRLLSSPSRPFAHLHSLCLQTSSSFAVPMALDDIQSLSHLSSLTALSLRYWLDRVCIRLLLGALPSLQLLDLHDCSFMQTYLKPGYKAVLSLVTPVFLQLHTLLLPSRGELQLSELDDLLIAALPHLTYLDTTNAETHNTTAALRSVSITALHVGRSATFAAVTQSEQTVDVTPPLLPNLRQLSFGTGFNSPPVRATAYIAFFHSYCAQLTILELNLQSLEDESEDVLSSVLSCCQLTVLLLSVRRSLLDTAAPRQQHRLAPLHHLHTLSLTWTNPTSMLTAPAGVMTFLCACTSARHVQLSSLALHTSTSRNTELVSTIGQLCPNLVTLFIDTREGINQRSATVALPQITRPLFPSLQAAYIASNQAMQPVTADAIQRENEQSRRCVKEVAALLAPHIAPMLQHLVLVPYLDSFTLPLLRPLTGTAHTVPSAERGAATEQLAAV